MHSYELYALLALCTALIGVYAFWHARRYWEGLPPLLDAFVSMAGFLAIIGSFVAAGRMGDHPHAARVVAVTLAVIAIRSIRTWIGKEQARYRAARARKPTGETD